MDPKEELIASATFILDQTGSEPDVDITADDAIALAKLVLQYFGETEEQ